MWELWPHLQCWTVVFFLIKSLLDGVYQPGFVAGPLCCLEAPGPLQLGDPVSCPVWSEGGTRPVCRGTDSCPQAGIGQDVGGGHFRSLTLKTGRG